MQSFTYPKLNTFKIIKDKPLIVCDADEVIFDFMNSFEIYLHTKEVRGRENFFAQDYEKPTDPRHLSIDTGKLNIKESLNEILNVYRKMATMA